MNAAGFQPTLKQLRAFVAVYQVQKIGAAAEQLSLTQSAVSVLIRQLEDGLGTRLFDRTTRSLRPTAAAVDAVVVAERILRDVNSLAPGMQDLSQLRRGRVSLAVTPALGAILLPAAVERFLQLHPGVQVVVDDCAPDQFISRIVGEQVDFGLGTPEGAAADVDVKMLRRDHLAVVCRNDHPLATSRQAVSWAQLAHHPVITVRPGYGIRARVDAAAAQAGVQLRVASEVSFFSTALWMVGCGLGAAIMPTAYAQPSRDPGLVLRSLKGPRVSRDIAVVTKRGRSLSPAAAGLVDLMRAMVGKTLEPPRTA
jgi:DNA-binding transcriptional LysR family regulator